MVWDELVAFLDGARITAVELEGYWEDEVVPRDFHPLGPVYLTTDRGLLRVAETSHGSCTVSCHVVDAPTFENYEDLAAENSPNLGVANLGFDLLGIDISDASVRGLRCAYGTEARYEGRILAMTILAEDDEAVTFNPWYYLNLRVTAGDSLDRILATNGFLSGVPRTIRAWHR